MEEKTREEVEEKYKWDLSTIYKNESELIEEYNKVNREIEKFKENEKTFLNNSENLYNTLKTYYNIDVILDKLWTYVNQKYDEDIANNENQAWKEKVHTLYEVFSEKTSFLSPKLLEFGLENIESYYKENPKLEKEYGFVLENIFREKPHILSEREEKLISSLSKAFSNTIKISNMLSDSEIEFETITDEEGKTVKLTNANYSTYIMSKDRNVRKAAFKANYKALKQFNNTFALALSAFVDKKTTFSKIRHFNSSLEAALFSDNVSVDVYNNLIDTVSKNLDNLYKYYKIKQKALNLDEMHLYDIYVDISKEVNNKYTFEEAKHFVLDALNILGKDYITNLNRAFTEKWIDIYPNKGKRGGAYSGGSYLTNPFLLLNFEGNYFDVSTLAHELGHSMHSFYSCKNNPVQYGYYEIFVAEVVSQVNELLFNDYMLNKVKTKEEKINILNQILELFKASIFRQTMFAEFEKIISEKNEKGEILTAEVLNNTYYKLVQKYFGNDIIIDEEIKYEWEGIPHFYYDFYVYKYGVGLAAACHIVKEILEGKENAKENYLEFLKTGGSMYPLDELKVAGVDLTDPKVIQSAIDMFKDYLNELENLLSN